MNPLRRLCVLLAAAALSNAAHAAEVSIAAAANLVYALAALDTEFERQSPGVTVTSTVGASGSLVAQITQGAPYDVFLSADPDYPKALIKSGKADPATFSPFAVGRLVLWTMKPGLELTDVARTVRNPGVRTLAIANAATAPYGKAARQALNALGLWDDAQPKLVTGENISQTAQFVQTGNADAGFVALSIVLSPKLKEKGRWIEIPSTLYGSLEQCAIVTAHGSANPLSARYIAFLHSDAANRILESFGYGIPRWSGVQP